MHLLEGRFRRQFVRDGAGYRFHIWDQDVPFTQAEFDAFVAQRRRVWSNPGLWAAYLAFGLALPAALLASGHDIGGWSLAAFGLLFMAVLLIHVDRKPIEAAQDRAVAPAGGTRRRRSAGERILVALLWMALAGGWAFSRKAGPPEQAIWAGVLLLWAFELFSALRQWWRERRARAG